MPVFENVETLPLAGDADGVIRVARTRVTLETLVGAFQDGATAEEIAQQYPSVSLADIYQIVGYYLRHKAEVEAYLSRCQRTSEAIREENERRWRPEGIRARLLARRRGDAGVDRLR
ncbi:MAG: DUF433 domain-containing protein [Bryobacteraceae bacterium]